MKTKTLGKFPGGNSIILKTSRNNRHCFASVISFSKSIRVMGALAGALLCSGCELEASEQGETPVTENATNSAAAISTNAPAELSLGQTNLVADTNLVSEAAEPELSLTSTNILASTGSTNAPGGTNIVANQEITILNEIPPAAPENLDMSWTTEQVVKLAQSGLGDSVLLSYVQKSTNAFNLDAEDIMYLHDIGVSEEVIAAMLNHDGADPALAAAPKKEPEVEEQTPPPSALPQQSMVDLGAAPAPQQMEYTTNYIPNEIPNGAIAGQYPQAEPQQQQQVVVQQQPIIVQQQPTVVVTEPAVAYSTFYSSLSPYGSWLYVADYGWCWQPTVAVSHSGWRPYLHNGRWVYSNHGWYWHSDYSWGWAPFHYGRWHQPRGRGWVWVPDHTWGPSWVTWRVGRDYCGWAPLPPRSRYVHGVGLSYRHSRVDVGFSFGYSHSHYNFVPTRHFADRRVHRHALPSHRTVNVYKETTVVNNYIQGNNNTIINAGVSRDHIERVSRTEVPKVSVRETPAAGRLVRPDRISREGSDLVVYKPSSVNRPGSQPQPGNLSSGISSSRMGQEPSRASALAPGASRMERWGATPTVSEPNRANPPSQARAISPRAASQLGNRAVSPTSRAGVRIGPSGTTTEQSRSPSPTPTARGGQELQRRGSTTPPDATAGSQAVPSRRGGVPVVQNQTAGRVGSIPSG
ncbi:MAG: DUF6600 domain-containing protein, partial [Verrucomicrobiales bacterium]